MFRPLLATAVIGAICAAAFISSVTGATNAENELMVTREDDPPPVACEPGDCSLREAVLHANQNPGHHTIIVPPGVYTLSIPPTEADDEGLDGDLDLTDDVDVIGQGAHQTIIQACDPSPGPCTGIDRIFEVHPGVTAHIDSFELRRGSSGDRPGGAIENFGDLTLRSVTVRENVAGAGGAAIHNHAGAVLDIQHSLISLNTGHDGATGGIETAGSLSLSFTRIAENSAGDHATGGLRVLEGASLSVTHSGIIGNSAGDGGTGGAEVFTDGLFINTTISGNTAGSGGTGGLRSAFETVPAALAVIYSTVADNTAGDGGVGGIRDDATVTINSSIVAGNAPSDCGGEAVIRSSGHNLSGDASCQFDTSGDLNETDPQLGPLEEIPGFAPAHLPDPDSPVIDAGDPNNCPENDQRLVSRPQGGACDIGAVESEPVAPTPMPGQPGTWGDVNCDGNVDTVDALALLRHVAGLTVSQTQPCPALGDAANVDGTQRVWGDNNCSTAADTVDALATLRHVAGLPVSQTQPCPALGDAIFVLG